MIEGASASAGDVFESEAGGLASEMRNLLPKERDLFWKKFAGWLGWAASMGGIGVAQIHAVAARASDDETLAAVGSAIVSSMVCAVLWKHYTTQWRAIAPTVERYRKRMEALLRACPSLVVRAHAESVGINYRDLVFK